MLTKNGLKSLEKCLERLSNNYLKVTEEKHNPMDSLKDTIYELKGTTDELKDNVKNLTNIISDLNVILYYFFYNLIVLFNNYQI